MKSDFQPDSMAPPSQDPLSALGVHRQVELAPAEFACMLSPYLAGGIAEDRFEIVSLFLEGKEAQASVRMTTFYTSPTDPGGFHLSAPMTMQIFAQVGIVHGHVMLDLKGKHAEVWSGEYSVKHRRPIRNPNEIRVRTKIIKAWHARRAARTVVLDYEFIMNEDAAIARGNLYLRSLEPC